MPFRSMWLCRLPVAVAALVAKVLPELFAAVEEAGVPVGLPRRISTQRCSVLRRLFLSVPALRVVLAGRRWLVPPPTELQAVAEPIMRPRPYLTRCDTPSPARAGSGQQETCV